MMYRILPIGAWLCGLAALCGLLQHQIPRASIRADLWQSAPSGLNAPALAVFVFTAVLVALAGLLSARHVDRAQREQSLVAALVLEERLRRAILLVVLAACISAAYLRGSARAREVLPLTEPVADVLVVAEVVSGCRPARPPCSAIIALRAARHPTDGWRPAEGRYYLSIDENPWLPIRGHLLRARVALEPFEPAMHRFAFDAQRWGNERRLRGFARLNAEAIRIESKTTLAMRIDRFRQRAEEAILRRDDNTPGRVLVAMLTGSRTGLDPEVRERFAESGIAHVLAVSGLHFALLVGSIWWLIERLLRRALHITSRRTSGQLSALATIPLAALYVIFTGSPASALRAGLMVGTLLLSRVADRPASSLHALSAAFYLMVIADPVALLSRGFQLSMAATCSLVVFSLLQRQHARSDGDNEGAESWVQSLTRCIRTWLVASFQVSTVTAAATAPIIVWMTGVIPLASHLGNILVVPLLALIALPLAAIGAFLSAALGQTLPSTVSIELALLASRTALSLAEWGESWLALSAVVGRPQGLGLAGWLLLAACTPFLCVPWRRDTPRLRQVVGALVALALALACVAGDRSVRRLAHGELEIHAIPVGQGDATLVLSGPRDTILIDAGGRGFGDAEIGRRYVLPYLRSMGIRRVDLVVVSHGDADHALGVLEILEDIRPAMLWLPGEVRPAQEQRVQEECVQEQRSAEGRDLIEEIADAASALETLVHFPGVAGARTELGALTLQALPAAPELAGNDGSLVLRLDHGASSALFTGDVEAQGEAWLLRSPLAHDIDYLKVAHHGSATSSSDELLRAIRPGFAVIHLGHRNRYGMPNPDVVLRLLRSARVHRTDQGHAVIHRSDGEGFDVLSPAY